MKKKLKSAESRNKNPNLKEKRQISPLINSRIILNKNEISFKDQKKNSFMNEYLNPESWIASYNFNKPNSKAKQKPARHPETILKTLNNSFTKSPCNNKFDIINSSLKQEKNFDLMFPMVEDGFKFNQVKKTLKNFFVFC